VIVDATAWTAKQTAEHGLEEIEEHCFQQTDRDEKSDECNSRNDHVVFDVWPDVFLDEGS